MALQSVPLLSSGVFMLAICSLLSIGCYSDHLIDMFTTGIPVCNRFMSPLMFATIILVALFVVYQILDTFHLLIILN